MGYNTLRSKARRKKNDIGAIMKHKSGGDYDDGSESEVSG